MFSFIPPSCKASNYGIYSPPRMKATLGRRKEAEYFRKFWNQSDVHQRQLAHCLWGLAIVAQNCATITRKPRGVQHWIPKALRKTTTNGKMDSLEGQEVATISAESPKNPFSVLIATLPSDKLQPSAVTGFSMVSHFTCNIPT